jgi:Zn finger protein HypA/HybF involved in hydrogenase expression
MTDYYIVKDVEGCMSECLDCGHESIDHAEYEVEGQEEAEVVCPKCHSYHFYLKEMENA